MTMASRSITQIVWNVTNGISSHDDVKTLLGRYQELMEDVKEVDPQLWKVYKRREKQA